MSIVLTVGDREIGDGQPCFIVAEAGVNHNGELELAHRLVDSAADAGAEAVKFQTFRPDELVARGAEAAPYQRIRSNSEQHSMLAQLALPDTAWAELADHAAERNLVFLSTAFDEASAVAIVALGVPALKVPSGELNNLPFIRTLAAHGLPLLISTGMGNIDEVKAAVEAAGAAPGIALLHCVSAYPAPEAEANLKAITTMRKAFDVPVGWSDHTLGAVTAVAAVALGAALLEKHLTLDRGMPGPDHDASADPDQFAAYVRDVRTATAALGDGDKRPTSAEEENRFHARRSVHAAKDLVRGHLLEPSDVVLLRPADGLPPDVDVIGRRLARDIRSASPINEDDLE